MKPAPPSGEIQKLTHLIVLALDLAGTGLAGEGYTCLVEGLCRVKGLRDTGEPWGEELVGHYFRTLNDYADRFNVARE